MPASRTTPSLATLTASRVSAELGGRTVLRDVSFVVGPSTRLGIVGPNGVGKSTLLRILAGHLAPTEGGVDLAPPNATIGYLAQEPERRSAESVVDYLRRATGVADAETALERSAAGLAGGSEQAAEDYSLALERWQQLGAADLDARVDAVLADLGLAAGVREQPTASLSGGQAARVALAAILLSRFDVTLLDEPTNDLDFEGLGRLERFVVGRQGAVVVVSHDRQFLDNTISSVLELDDHERTATLYRGGWSAYLEERATARRHASQAFADYRTQRTALLERARRERQWATSGVGKEKRQPRDNDKAQRKFRVEQTEQLAARARRTERALQRMEVVEKPWEGWDLRFTINEAPRAGAVVARLDGAVVERGTFCLGPVDLQIAWGERVALLGANGAGKTTLIDALVGRLPLVAGQRALGPSVVVGEIGQRRGAFAGADTILEGFTSATGLDVSAARSLLAKFGLGASQVVQPARSLSPGERTRAELAVFQARSVNFVVLDEPTNHLDLPAVEELETALAGYGGTLLVVSHDRQFLDALEVTRAVDVAAHTGAPGRAPHPVATSSGGPRVRQRP